MKIIAALALVIGLSGAGWAAAAETPPPSAERLALAKEMVIAAGGDQQMRTVLSAMVEPMRAQYEASSNPAMKRIGALAVNRMQDFMLEIVPKVTEAMATIYASELSTDEMRDYLKWQKSPTGQSFTRKLPLITQRTMQQVMPLITSQTAAMQQSLLNDVCKEVACSNQDREQLTTLLKKAAPPQPT